MFLDLHIICMRKVCLVVALFWLVVVFAVVSLGVPCFLSCRVGGYFVTLWNVGAQVSCSRHSAASGRHVMRARLASGMGAHAVVRKSTFYGVFKTKKRAPANRR